MIEILIEEGISIYLFTSLVLNIRITGMIINYDVELLYLIKYIL